MLEGKRGLEDPTRAQVCCEQLFHFLHFQLQKGFLFSLRYLTRLHPSSEPRLKSAPEPVSFESSRTARRAAEREGSEYIINTFLLTQLIVWLGCHFINLKKEREREEKNVEDSTVVGIKGG